VAKLYFRYGTMDSAKSMNLLAVAHNYRKQGKKILLIKPKLDTRFGNTKIASRSGLEAEADVMLEEGAALDPKDFADVDCVLVDEAQFLSPAVIEDFRRITVDPGVPVICYGLRTDFRTRLFPGAQRLMELADRIEEVKVTCQYCAKKAICNLRLVDGVATVEGPQILLGSDEQYVPVCWMHYDRSTRAATRADTDADAQAARDASAVNDDDDDDDDDDDVTAAGS
jgi:thymidine kinase